MIASMKRMKHSACALILLGSAVQITRGEISLANKVRQSVLKAFTLESVMLHGVAIPFVQEKVGDSVPDSVILGVSFSFRDIWKAIVAAVTTAGWNKFHYESEFKQNLIHALYAEVGYVGLQEIARKIGVADMVSDATRSNYKHHGVGYVKAALAAVIKEFVRNFSQAIA